MSETTTPKPTTITEIFEEVRDKEHAALKQAHIEVVLAEAKQSRPIILERVTSPEMRRESGLDALIKVCPKWFEGNNPAQTTIEDPASEVRRAEIVRMIDTALCGVALNDEEDGLAAVKPELPGTYKAIAMRYGIDPQADPEAYEVVGVLVARSNQGLEFGEELPSKYAPAPAEPQEKLDVEGEDAPDAAADAQEAAGGAAEDEVAPTPTEEVAEAPAASEEPAAAVSDEDPWGAGNNLGKGV